MLSRPLLRLRAVPAVSFLTPLSSPLLSLRPRTRRSFAASAGASIIGQSLGHALDLRTAYVGQALNIPYETTVGEAWRDQWQSNFYQHDRLYTSLPFARSLAFTDTVLPYSLMLNKTVSMSHVDASLEVMELGFENAVYVRPAYAGQTFKKQYTIKHIRNTTDHRNTIITVTCELFNSENDELVFSVDKLMMFFQVTNPSKLSREPTSKTPAPPSHLLSHIVLHSRKLPASVSLAGLRPHQAILHSLVKPVGKSANMALNTLFRYSHPQLSNYARYKDSEIVVPGGIVLSAAIAASSRTLYEVLHEQIVNCSFLNKVSPVDAIGAISYVRDIRDLEDGLEEVTLKTIGVKNVDVTKDLHGVALPMDLFNKELVGAKLEELIEQECPVLRDKVVVQAVRKLVRQSPYAAAVNIPLL